MPNLPNKFHENWSTTSVILLTDKQTNKVKTLPTPTEVKQEAQLSQTYRATLYVMSNQNEGSLKVTRNSTDDRADTSSH